MWLAILIKRGIRIKIEVLNQYLHVWWSSSMYFYCSLFNYWIYRKKSISISRLVIRKYISYELLYCVYYIPHFCYLLLLIILGILYCFFIILFSYCTLFLIVKFYWLNLLFSLYVFLVLSSLENWNGVNGVIRKMSLLFHNCYVLHTIRYLLMKF